MTPSDQERDALLARRMPFLEHLVELRTRLRNGVLALLVAFFVGWALRGYLLRVIAAPLDIAMSHVPVADRNLIYTDPMEPLMVQLTVAAVFAIFLAVPVLFQQIWKFVAPGLYPKERRLALPVIVLSVLLFFGGAAFCYYLVLPRGLDLLLGYGSNLSGFMALFGKNVHLNFALHPRLSLDEYFSFELKLLLVFGTVFELPLVLGLLAIFGIVTPGKLWRFNRYAILFGFVAGAVFTPGDMVFGQIAMGGALTVLYNVSILVALIVGKKGRAEAAKAEGETEAEEVASVD